MKSLVLDSAHTIPLSAPNEVPVFYQPRSRSSKGYPFLGAQQPTYSHFVTLGEGSPHVKNFWNCQRLMSVHHSLSILCRSCRRQRKLVTPYKAPQKTAAAVASMIQNSMKLLIATWRPGRRWLKIHMTPQERDPK